MASVAATNAKTVKIKAEVLTDLASRFLINLSNEDKEDPIKLCSHIELARWYYLDLLRPEDPNLPGCNFKEFMIAVVQHCPWLIGDSSIKDLDTLIAQWKARKYKKPVRGAIILNQDWTKCLLVQGYPSGISWGFPKGKIEEEEVDSDAAVREVYEETGFDMRKLIQKDCYLEANVNDSNARMYIIPGIPEDTVFEPKTRYEIRNIQWFKIKELPAYKKDTGSRQALGKPPNNFFTIIPFIGQLRKWLQNNKKNRTRVISASFKGSKSKIQDQQSKVYQSSSPEGVAHRSASNPPRHDALVSSAPQVLRSVTASSSPLPPVSSSSPRPPGHSLSSPSPHPHPGHSPSPHPHPGHSLSSPSPRPHPGHALSSPSPHTLPPPGHSLSSPSPRPHPPPGHSLSSPSPRPHPPPGRGHSLSSPSPHPGHSLSSHIPHPPGHSLSSPSPHPYPPGHSLSSPSPHPYPPGHSLSSPSPHPYPPLMPHQYAIHQRPLLPYPYHSAPVMMASTYYTQPSLQQRPTSSPHWSQSGLAGPSSLPSPHSNPSLPSSIMHSYQPNPPNVLPPHPITILQSTGHEASSPYPPRTGQGAYMKGKPLHPAMPYYGPNWPLLPTPGLLVPMPWPSSERKPLIQEGMVSRSDQFSLKPAESMTNFKFNRNSLIKY